ncbi:MAG: DUF554 domain-containing protein [Candidatus Thorarchaeota archaeon]
MSTQIIGVGNVVNFTAIIIGSILGLVVGDRFSEKAKETGLQGMGLVVIALGIAMALETEYFLIMILSIAFGGVIGEILDIEGKTEQLGEFLQERVGRDEDEGRFVQGFVTATILFCTGPLAIIGGIEDGLGDPEVLLNKAALDGFASIALASTLGVGVIFSAVVVFLYQGFFVVLASQLEPLLSDELIREIGAVGGIMILGIGVNLTKIGSIRCANLIPAFLVLLILLPFAPYIPS